MQDNERKAWQKGGSAAKAIGAYVARMLDPVARARGFAITSLLSEWPTVVGEELASFTAPDKLMWPTRGLPRPSGGLGQASAARRRDLEGLIFPERRRTQVCKENSPGSSEKPGLLGCRSNRA
jgi:hypothetical protein